MYVIQEGGVRITFHDSHQKVENGEFKAVGSESGDRDSEVRAFDGSSGVCTRTHD